MDEKVIFIEALTETHIVALTIILCILAIILWILAIIWGIKWARRKRNKSAQASAFVPEPPAGGTQRSVSISCRLCKKDITEDQFDRLVSKSSADDIEPKCPICGKAVVSQEFGCPTCRYNFWAYGNLLGHQVACPNCSIQVTLPTIEEWSKLVKGSGKFKWKVVSSGSGEATTTGGLDDIVSGITSGRFRPDDISASHEFAPWRSLRKMCDEHFKLRKLYDPLGAYTFQVGMIVGCTFFVLFLIGHLIHGLMGMGGTYLLWALFGILGFVLAPTIIGLVIVYFIAGACGVPLHFACLGVFVVSVMASLAGLIGGGIGYGVTWVVAKATGLEGKRTVNW